jgi:outer membrane murein-binding lipoprotein Lpp
MKRRQLFVLLLAALMAWVAGCASPSGGGADTTQLVGEKTALQARVDQLQSQVDQLQIQIADLQRNPQPGKPADLINPNYPPAVAGSEGWVYHKTLDGDFDGDGVTETVHVTTNAFWDEQHDAFGWDDGHPWHVYVQEPDGTRTYLFSEWVQLGTLKVMKTAEEPPQVIIAAEGGTGLALFKATYHGPGKAEAVTLANEGVNGIAAFADSKYHE